MSEVFSLILSTLQIGGPSLLADIMETRLRAVTPALRREIIRASPGIRDALDLLERRAEREDRRVK